MGAFSGGVAPGYYLVPLQGTVPGPHLATVDGHDQLNGKMRHYPHLGAGVICNGIPFETPVIPAKAGIQSVESASAKVCALDSRFRGNDCDVRRPCLAIDTSPGSR